MDSLGRPHPRRLAVDARDAGRRARRGRVRGPGRGLHGDPPPVADVFEAFVDPAVTTHFWFSRGDARLAPGVRTQWHWAHIGARAEVEVLVFEAPRRLRIAWGDADGMTTVDWTFTALDDARSFVETREHGFTGDRATVVARALDSTGGFHLVLAGAKAWLEHGLALELVRDHMPADGAHSDA